MAKKPQKRSNRGGTLFKRGKIWHAQWMVDGKMFAKTTGTRDKQEAEKKLMEFTAPFRMGGEVEALEAMSARIAGRKAAMEKLEDEVPSTTIKDGWAVYLNQANRPDTGEAY